MLYVVIVPWISIAIHELDGFNVLKIYMSRTIDLESVYPERWNRGKGGVAYKTAANMRVLAADETYWNDLERKFGIESAL